MDENLKHANCGGNITKNAETGAYRCDTCDEAGIAVQHTGEGEAMILKQSTEAEIEKIEAEADDHI